MLLRNTTLGDIEVEVGDADPKDPETERAARHFVSFLHSQGKVAVNCEPENSHTHRVVTDPAGHQRLERVGFNGG